MNWSHGQAKKAATAGLWRVSSNDCGEDSGVLAVRVKQRASGARLSGGDVSKVKCSREAGAWIESEVQTICVRGRARGPA